VDKTIKLLIITGLIWASSAKAVIHVFYQLRDGSKVKVHMKGKILLAKKLSSIHVSPYIKPNFPSMRIAQNHTINRFCRGNTPNVQQLTKFNT
jgi:hypothetical protein